MATAIGRVPADRIRPLVVDYCEHYATYDIVCDTATQARRSMRLSPYAILARDAGISRSMIEELRRGRCKTLDFDVADRLLCAMHLFYLWYGDLKDIYYGTQLVA